MILAVRYRRGAALLGEFILQSQGCAQRASILAQMLGIVGDCRAIREER